MKETDSLDALLREWKLSEPGPELDRRIIAGCRTAMGSRRDAAPFWRRFWAMRISIPAPALMAAALVVVALLLWLRPAVRPVQNPGAVTRLNITGFEPLPNGDARVVPAVEGQR